MRVVISIIFTLLLLFTNVGLTFGTHYCGGHAVKHGLLLFEKQLGCGMEKNNLNSCRHDNNDQNSNEQNLSNKSCCENKYFSVEIKDNFSQSIGKFELSTDFTFININFQSDYNFSPQVIFPQYGNYYPPPLEKDIQILFQTFII